MMNNYYDDIMKKIATPPVWFDENAVPRYCKFSPRRIADIYANECALVRIACQSCGTLFKVAFSQDTMDDVKHRMMFEGKPLPSLADRIKDKSLFYGDPPNVECCPAGPTMSSVPIQIIQYWERKTDIFKWVRHKDLEVEIEPDWAKGTNRQQVLG